MLCSHLLYNSVSQLYTHISLSCWASPPSPHPSVITELQAGLSVLYSIFPLAICFAYDRVYMLVLLSRFVPPSSSPSVSTRPFSTSASPFLLCKQVHLYYFSRFHIYALIYDICSSLWMSPPNGEMRRSHWRRICGLRDMVGNIFGKPQYATTLNKIMIIKSSKLHRSALRVPG